MPLDTYGRPMHKGVQTSGFQIKRVMPRAATPSARKPRKWHNHAFKVTVQFDCEMRVAEAQAILRARLGHFDSFTHGFVVKKVRRITRCS